MNLSHPQPQEKIVKNRVRNLFVALALLALSAFSPQLSTCFAQGSLTPPPGAPAPTMLTLSQIEPRTPVDAAHTPGSGLTVFAITNAGSYYLTTNIIVTSSYGIEIFTNNVSIDLKGFNIVGGLYGIVISSSTTNCTVRNGSISGSSYGAIDSDGSDDVFEDLNIFNTDYGIECFGDCGVIKDCSFYRNGNTGIILYGGGYVIADNNCSGNNILNAANGASIFIDTSNNHIENNYITGSGPAGYGIWINNQTFITNNIVIRNSVAGGGANNYEINGSLNDVGPIGSASTLTSPWGNISHP